MWQPVRSVHVGFWAATFFLSCASFAGAQLPFHEGFETDGDGTRYTITDRGYVANTGDSGPAIWGHNFDAAGGDIGLVQNAPAKRAAILWDDSLTIDDVSSEALQAWVSLHKWAIDGKENATIGFLPQHQPGNILPVIIESGGHTIIDVPDPADLPDPSQIDLLIHTSSLEATSLPEYPVPVIAYRSSNHDDTGILGIGDVTDFDSPTSVTIVPENQGHPAISELMGSISWTVNPATLNTLGKPQGGGQVLATFENPVSGIEEPAIFVVEEGGGLLGGFNPVPSDGESYIVGAALNKFGDMLARTLDLNPVDVTGEADVKLTVAVAATDADFDNEDVFNIYLDPHSSGDFQLLANYVPITAGAQRGGLEDTVSGHVLNNAFQDLTFDVPADATALTIRFEAFNTWGNEIVGIDNIRISAQSALLCDINGDGVCNIVDIDALMSSVANGGNEASFDLDTDGSVDDGDRDVWLADAATANGLSAPYLLGDTKLDLVVDSLDLNNLALSWQSDNNNWSAGNVTGGGVNAGDLNEIALNWQTSHPDAPAAAAVPEPTAMVMVLAGVFGLFAVHRQREASFV